MGAQWGCCSPGRNTPIRWARFTAVCYAIAPDLPGIGDSDIPAEWFGHEDRRPGRMHAGWAYFAAWPQTAKDFARLSHTRLNMPLLSIAGDKASAAVLGSQMKLVAADATEIVLKDTGHWVLEERPKETTEAILKFL